MTWTYDVVIDLAKRMEAKVLSGFRVSAKTAPLIVDALKRYARERFGESPNGYTVDVWTPDDSRIERHYASVSDLFAARDAFARAAEQFPNSPVTIRQGIRVIARSEGKR